MTTNPSDQPVEGMQPEEEKPDDFCTCGHWRRDHEDGADCHVESIVEGEPFYCPCTNFELEEEKMIETIESRQIRARELMNRADWQITKEDVLDGEALFYSRKRGNSPLRMDLCAEIVFLMRKLDRLRELPSPPPAQIAELEKIMAMYEATAKLSPQPQPDKPTFAHSLAGYLTRNGQRGDWTEMEKEIQQFMGDSKLEVTRAT